MRSRIQILELTVQGPRFVVQEPTFRVLVLRPRFRFRTVLELMVEGLTLCGATAV